VNHSPRNGRTITMADEKKDDRTLDEIIKDATTVMADRD